MKNVLKKHALKSKKPKSKAPTTATAKSKNPAAPPADAGATTEVGNAAFRRAVVNLKKLHGDVEYESARGKYDFGAGVKDVVDEPATYGLKSGAQAVALLMKESGLEKDAVYSGLKVAATWDRMTFTSWLQKEGPDGCKLSFEHFVLAAKIEDPTSRDALLEKAISEHLSTRALRPLCAKRKGVTLASARRLLQGTIKQSLKCLVAFQNLAGEVEALDVTEVSDALKLTDRASELQYQLGEVCRRNATALAKKRDGIPPAPTLTAVVVLPAPVLLSATNPQAVEEERAHV